VITKLGTLENHDTSGAADISQDGSTVVGFSSLSSDLSNTTRAFRWTAAGGMHNLGTLPNTARSNAAAVSANGSFVAGSSAIGRAASSAFRFTISGMENLGTLPGGIAHGQDISADGSVVVGASGGVLITPTHPIFLPNAFLWTAGSGMQPLGALMDHELSSANAVSNDGNVVAGSSNFDIVSPARAVRWTSQGGIIDLGLLPGSDYATALAISGDGVAVSGTSGGRLFRWTESGGMRDLGVLPGDDIASPGSMDDSGSMIVGVSRRNQPLARRAFLWADGLGLVDLNVYLPTLGADLAGWQLTDATGISGDGSTIVGEGLFHGVERAWIVNNVPEPGAAVSACVAVLLPRAVRRSFDHLRLHGKAGG
jgi:probable HAF family extracellular repeat protein